MFNSLVHLQDSRMKDKLPYYLRFMTPVVDENDETVRLVRKQPPEHHRLKVESYSVFRNDDHFDSKKFWVAGYFWVLSVYPDGNGKEGGFGNISLYVSMVDTIMPGSIDNVNVTLRFFIYDQIRNNYLTILDLSDKTFDGLGSARGIAEVLPRVAFTDPVNGYLVDDSCEFGVEVLVKDNRITKSIVSIEEPQCDWSYTWKIENFTKLNTHNPVWSGEFSMGRWVWALSLHPSGDRNIEGGHISLYLHLFNPHILPPGCKLYIRSSIGFKSRGNGDDQMVIVKGWFSDECTRRGHPRVITAREIERNYSRHFLENDTVIVEVKVEEKLVLKGAD